jgi:tryptophan synthase alpha subunit
MSLHENPNLKENKPIHPTMLQSSTVSQSRPSSLGDESQDYWYYCSHSYITDDQNKSRYEKKKKTRQKNGHFDM